MFLLNAFSLNMLPAGGATIRVRTADLEQARLACADSAVGHADTARIFSAVLGVPVAWARRTIAMQVGDCAVVGQYRGPRLPEGATELPEGSAVEWLLVEVFDEHTPEMDALEAWHPSEEFITIPSISELGAQPEPWLVAHYKQYARSGSDLNRALAVALVGRLSDQARFHAYPGQATPLDSARGWWLGLSEAQRRRVLREALFAIGGLQGELRLFEVDMSTATRDALLVWLRERDDLQGLLWLAPASEDPMIKAVKDALGALDRSAAKFDAIWQSLAPIDDDRLRAVACCEPDCWWSQLADFR